MGYQIVAAFRGDDDARCVPFRRLEKNINEIRALEAKPLYRRAGVVNIFDIRAALADLNAGCPHRHAVRLSWARTPKRVVEIIMQQCPYRGCELNSCGTPTNQVTR
jgi:hypothetical protein